MMIMLDDISDPLLSTYSIKKNDGESARSINSRLGPVECVMAVESEGGPRAPLALVRLRFSSRSVRHCYLVIVPGGCALPPHYQGFHSRRKARRPTATVWLLSIVL
jgi:hypothetical protein